jgi:tellurite resistance protein TerC
VGETFDRRRTIERPPIAMTVSVGIWALFCVAIVALLLVDLLVAGRAKGIPPMRHSIAWSVFWLVLAVAFTGVLMAFENGTAAGEYLTGYLIERSLSLDNLFVFALLFTFFAVPDSAQRKVLFWGIIGAIVLRAGFIFAGAALLDAFHWMIYVFGALLVFTGIRMATHDNEEIHPERNPVLRMVRRIVPLSDDYDGDRIITRKAGKRLATPLLAALVMVATFDVVFAIDSIPAIFAITRDTFIVFAANAFSLLGLMSLYFLLAGLIQRFRYLHYGLAAILVWVGVKMLITDVWHVPTALSLAVIAICLGIAITVSWRTEEEPVSEPGGDGSSRPHDVPTGVS